MTDPSCRTLGRGEISSVAASARENSSSIATVLCAENAWPWLYELDAELVVEEKGSEF